MSEIFRMNVIKRIPPLCAFHTRIFLEHSAEDYAQRLDVTFCSDPCALELIQLRNLEISPSTTASHINHETIMIIYIYNYNLITFKWQMRMVRLNFI